MASEDTNNAKESETLFAIDRGDVPQDTLRGPDPTRIPKKRKEESSDEEEGQEPEPPKRISQPEDDDDDIFVLDDDDDDGPKAPNNRSLIAGKKEISMNPSLNTQEATAMLISGSLGPPGVTAAIPLPPSLPRSSGGRKSEPMFQGNGPLVLPEGVILPPSITPELMSDRLREMLYQLPPETMKDAFLEYHNAVTAKGNSIRSHQAYLHGVLKRYVQLIGGEVKNLTKDIVVGGIGGSRKDNLGSYGPASVSANLKPEARAAPGVVTPSVNADFSHAVKDRLRAVVARGFGTEEDLREERVRSKLLALSEKDAINAIEELLGVDPTIIRNFASYFLGIINRYARGEGRAQKAEAAARRKGGAQEYFPSDRRRDDRGRSRRDRSRSHSPDYRRRSRSRSPDYHRSRSRRYRDRDSSHSRSPEYRRSRKHSRDYDDADYRARRRDRDRRSRSSSPSERDRRRRHTDHDRYSRHAGHSTPDEKTRAAAAQALNSAFNPAFPGQAQALPAIMAPQANAPGLGTYPMQPQQPGPMPFQPQPPKYPHPGQQQSWPGHAQAGQYLTPHQQAAYAAAAASAQSSAGGNSAFDILGLAEKAAEAVKLLGVTGGQNPATVNMMHGMPNQYGQQQPPPPPPRQNPQQQVLPGMHQYISQQPSGIADLPITIQYALQVGFHSLCVL